MEPVLPPDGALLLSPQPDPARLSELLARAPRLVLAACRLPQLYSPTPEHPVPSLPYKLDGLAPETLDALVASLNEKQVTWLVEADGAKGAGLKIPADHEPVIPTSAGCVVVCAHLDVIGQPVSDKTVHRLAQAEAIGLRRDSPITPDDFARVLTDSRAGLKGIPRGARVVALLTQRDSVKLHPEAGALAEQLVKSRKFDCAVVAALRAERPLLLERALRVAAIVLAAGGSTRMGQPKQLLDWRGKPLIRHVVEQVQSVQLDTIAVLGHSAAQVRAALEGSDVHLVVNPDWERGLSTSLRAGLAAAPDQVEAALFVHADQPNITPELLNKLIARWRESGASIVVPTHRGQRGTPVLFARELFDELAAISGDEGGRSLIQKYPARVSTVEIDDPTTLADIDTLEDYHAMTLHVSRSTFHVSRSTFHVSRSTFHLSHIRGLVSDMDGVLWRGNQPMPGLIEFFDFLRRAGIRFVLATNNASRASREYVERLAGFGVQVAREEILCAAEATAEYLATTMPGAGVFVIGEPPLKNALAERGLTILPEEAAQADCVVVGWDRNLSWKKLARATQLIRGGARFIGTNPDRTWPSEAGLLPGNGANLAFLQAATDVEPFIIGKPARTMFDQALARLGLEASAVAMLGDRLETDIEGGHNAGLATIFVCSGVSTREEAEQSPFKPDFIFEDISDLTRAWIEALR